MHPRPDGTRRFTEPATCCSFDVEKIGFHEEFFFHTFILYVREYRTHQRHHFVEHRRQNVDAASFLSLSCGMHFLVVTFFFSKSLKRLLCWLCSREENIYSDISVYQTDCASLLPRDSFGLRKVGRAAVTVDGTKHVANRTSNFSALFTKYYFWMYWIIKHPVSSFHPIVDTLHWIMYSAHNKWPSRILATVSLTNQL